MSKIGKMPITIPNGVTVTNENRVITITGPKGALNLNLSRAVDVSVAENTIVVSLKDSNKKALFGTTRSLLANMVKGVTEGWMKELELVGTGYRAEVRGDMLVLTVGFSHPVNFNAVEGIKFGVEKSVIKIEGIDKEKVGEVAAKVRAVRPPEPYKGKGIRYLNEVVRKKAGKAAKAGAGA